MIRKTLEFEIKLEITNIWTGNEIRSYRILKPKEPIHNTIGTKGDKTRITSPGI